MGLTLERPGFMFPALPFPMARLLAHHLNISGLSYLTFRKRMQLLMSLENCTGYQCENKYETASVQFSSVAQLRPTLWDPMNRSTPGLSVHHQLPEFPQTHVHRVRDAIQPSHPRSSPSPPAPNPSQHQSLFQWVNSSHEVAKVLRMRLKIRREIEFLLPELLVIGRNWFLVLLTVKVDFLRDFSPLIFRPKFFFLKIYPPFAWRIHII